MTVAGEFLNAKRAAVIYYEKRLTPAQRRFTRAFETLARVRALPARAEAAKAGRGFPLAGKAG